MAPPFFRRNLQPGSRSDLPLLPKPGYTSKPRPAVPLMACLQPPVPPSRIPSRNPTLTRSHTSERSSSIASRTVPRLRSLRYDRRSEPTLGRYLFRVFGSGEDYHAIRRRDIGVPWKCVCLDARSFIRKGDDDDHHYGRPPDPVTVQARSRCLHPPCRSCCFPPLAQGFMMRSLPFASLSCLPFEFLLPLKSSFCTLSPPLTPLPSMRSRPLCTPMPSFPAFP